MVWTTHLVGHEVRKNIKGHMFAGYTFGNYVAFENVVDDKKYKLVFDELQHLVWIYEAK